MIGEPALGGRAWLGGLGLRAAGLARGQLSWARRVSRARVMPNSRKGRKGFCLFRLVCSGPEHTPASLLGQGGRLRRATGGYCPAPSRGGRLGSAHRGSSPEAGRSSGNLGERKETKKEKNARRRLGGRRLGALRVAPREDDGHLPHSATPNTPNCDAAPRICGIYGSQPARMIWGGHQARHGGPSSMLVGAGLVPAGDRGAFHVRTR